MPLRWAGEPMRRGDYRVRHLLLAVAVVTAPVAFVERLISGSWLVAVGCGAVMYLVCSGWLIGRPWVRRRRSGA